uniref:hypothetical protein n=1 Tax=Halococcus agarilyticus TaxID=1232219 RepID=UPI000677C9C6
MSGVPERRIHGVDFSGGTSAAESIWITSGDIRDDRLEVQDCRSAADEFGTSDRDATLRALREFVAEREQAVFGFDFPFGVPKTVTDAEEWSDTIDSVSEHSSAEAMKEAYSERAREAEGNGVHLKRSTDETNNASPPYGLIPFRQMFHGVKHVLRPLLSNGSVSVLPMQEPQPDRAWALEIYPAETLDISGLCGKNYKGGDKASRKRRKRNLNGMLECANGMLKN